jgi:hypothetical protein
VQSLRMGDVDSARHRSLDELCATRCTACAILGDALRLMPTPSPCRTPARRRHGRRRGTEQCMRASERVQRAGDDEVTGRQQRHAGPATRSVKGLRVARLQPGSNSGSDGPLARRDDLQE